MIPVSVFLLYSQSEAWGDTEVYRSRTVEENQYYKLAFVADLGCSELRWRRPSSPIRVNEGEKLVASVHAIKGLVPSP